MTVSSNRKEEVQCGSSNKPSVMVMSLIPSFVHNVINHTQYWYNLTQPTLQHPQLQKGFFYIFSFCLLCTSYTTGISQTSVMCVFSIFRQGRGSSLHGSSEENLLIFQIILQCFYKILFSSLLLPLLLYCHISLQIIVYRVHHTLSMTTIQLRQIAGQVYNPIEC